jgi:predicted nucleotidyltransferase
VNLGVPLSVITPSLDAAVLHVLAATTRPSTGGEVAQRTARGSREGIRRVLARLVSQGVVLSDARSGVTLYSLNREHVTAHAIVEITRARGAIIDRITGHVSRWEPAPRHASLFGSFARGEADNDSDIDVLVVPSDTGDDHRVSASEAAAEDLSEAIRRWTGNHAHVVTTRTGVIAEMRDSRDPLLDSWRADHVHLWGERLADLARRAR